MSRLKRYTLALASGYLAVAANMLFTFASVPLAFQYLSKAEFGLWALCSQIAGYLALIDFGMAGAQSRILVDYKDETTGTNYGSTILTALLVGAVQGLVLLAGGAVVLWLLGPMPGVPADLGRQFRWLMFSQCALVAAGFLTRIVGNLLWAHQRSDVGNVILLFQFVVNYAVMWAAFANGAGVFSLLWGLLASTVVALVFSIAACARLKFFPSRSRWGRPTWQRFKELFAFGKDVFVFTLGSQMVNTSQTILISPLMGLEAAATWSVCIRPFLLAMLLVWRVLDFSATPLSEMLVRGEHERFFDRFRGVTVLTGAMAVVAGVVFAACNQPFVQLWTQGKVGWSVWNDVLLAIWGVFMAVQRCHCGLLGVRKDFGWVKYVYLAEGAVFVGLALVAARPFGFIGVIGSSLIATLSMSFLWGLRRSRSDFGLSWPQVLRWLEPAGRILMVLAPMAALLRWAVTGLAPVPALILLATSLGLVGGWLLFRLGLDQPMQARLAARVPGWMKSLLLAGLSRPSA